MSVQLEKHCFHSSQKCTYAVCLSVNTDTHNLAKCLDSNNGVMHFLFGVEGTGIASLSFAISSNYLSLCKKY